MGEFPRVYIQKMKPYELSFLFAVVLCMILFAVSFYHFPLLYWLKYVERESTEFGYSALYSEIHRFILGELYLALILGGVMLYLKNKFSRLSILMVEVGLLLETGAIPFLPLTYYLSPVELTSGLYFIYLIIFAPFILLFSIFFIYAAIKGIVGTRVVYSIAMISFIPVSLNVAGWILSGYTGTGGGSFLIALFFFLGWVLIWIGGILSFRFGLIPIILGTVMVWSPYGVGIILLALAYMLRTQEYSRIFYVALLVMLMGFSIGIYSIITAPPLR